ncbi:MAG: cation:proton antiporter [Candidatus Woesearchaeota archaeon]
MADVLFILLGIGVILFLGLLAEFIFKKTQIPDIVFLIAIGFIIGPNILDIVNVNEILPYAPLFTTVALLFLLYEGAFNISLKSFAQGALKSIQVTLFNFFVSAIVISIILYFFNYPIKIAILMGAILGGISSAFVIPLLKHLHLKSKTYSVLMLEAALTDVLVIVFAFAMMELILSNSINIFYILSNIVRYFGMAVLVGFICGIIYILFISEILNRNAPYMMTIAYLLIVYSGAELLHGTGAIAVLTLGIILKNSKPIIVAIRKRFNKEDKSKKITIIIKSHEEIFYSQVSFFLKTLFFVYIGMLFDIGNYRILLIAAILAVAILFFRRISWFITKSFIKYDRKIIMAMFARGLAAAAVAQIAVINNIPYASDISSITYAFIIFTIILSSIMIFIVRKSEHSHHHKSV